MGNVGRIQFRYFNMNIFDFVSMIQLDPTRWDGVLTAQDLEIMDVASQKEAYAMYDNACMRTQISSRVWYDIESVKSQVVQNRKTPSDYIRWAVENNQFLLLGEAHDSTATLPMVSSLLGEIKAGGMTTLALEMDTQFQPALDQFVNDGDGEKLSDSYQLYTGVLALRETYLDMLSKARQLGFRLVAIDDAGYHDESDLLVRRKVNMVMFEHLQQAVLWSHPDEKVAVVIGAAHANKDGDRLWNCQMPPPWLGYILEAYAPGHTHSVVVIDRSLAAAEERWGELGIDLGAAYALSFQDSFFYTLLMSWKPTEIYGPRYDGMIVLDVPAYEPKSPSTVVMYSHTFVWP